MKATLGDILHSRLIKHQTLFLRFLILGPAPFRLPLERGRGEGAEQSPPPPHLKYPSSKLTYKLCLGPSSRAFDVSRPLPRAAFVNVPIGSDRDTEAEVELIEAGR